MSPPGVSTGGIVDDLRKSNGPLSIIIKYCLAALTYIENALNNRSSSNLLHQLNCIWMKADVLLFLSNLYGQHGYHVRKEEGYALLALDTMIEAFSVSTKIKSPVLDLLTGQRAERNLNTTKGLKPNPQRFMKQGIVAELAQKSILAFDAEKAEPLIDFSRTRPISSITTRQVEVNLDVSLVSQQSMSYWDLNMSVN